MLSILKLSISVIISQPSSFNLCGQCAEKKGRAINTLLIESAITTVEREKGGEGNRRLGIR